MLASTSWGQVSFNGGYTMLNAFGTGAGPWSGLHVGVEVPRDDAISLYGKFTHCFAKSGDSTLQFATAIDPTTSPFTQEVYGVVRTNYTILEGGTRYYLGNGFDFGWAGYGGTNFMIMFNQVKTKYDRFDDTKYTLSASGGSDGSIFSAGVGLAGGVKYSVPRVGTFYTDVAIGYMFIAQGSNNTVDPALYSNLIFTVNVGYRYDILW